MSIGISNQKRLDEFEAQFSASEQILSFGRRDTISTVADVV